MGIFLYCKKEKKEDNIEKINENIIIGNIKITHNLFERIINSYENVIKEETNNCLGFMINGKENEKEIKNCEIYINNKKIDFNYYYNFPHEGNYQIKYIFKELLTSTNFMFYDCNSIISLDLSNFNTQNVTNMSRMFKDCNSFIVLTFLYI